MLFGYEVIGILHSLSALLVNSKGGIMTITEETVSLLSLWKFTLYNSVAHCLGTDEKEVNKFCLARGYIILVKFGYRANLYKVIMVACYTAIGLAIIQYVIHSLSSHRI